MAAEPGLWVADAALLKGLQECVGLAKTDQMLAIFNDSVDGSHKIQMSVDGVSTLLQDATESLQFPQSTLQHSPICRQIAAAISRVVGGTETEVADIGAFAQGLLMLSSEMQGARSDRALCTIIAIEHAVPHTQEDISFHELVDWLESYERNFTLMVAEVLSAIPPADATALLELQPDDPTIQAPLAELTDFIAQNGLGLDMAGRSERVERVFRGVASMLGADSSDTISSQLGLYDLKLFGGTPEGWDALCGLTRMDPCVPHLIQVQLGLTQQHYLPFDACGTQPLLSSFKARASHFIHSVGIRVLKNRLYSALPDPKVCTPCVMFSVTIFMQGVSKLVTMIASILPIDSKTLLVSD